jgi:hypothetical protein
MVNASLFRFGLLGALGCAALAAVATFGTSSLVSCASISDTSPLPDGDASDLDAGFVPVLDEAGGALGPPVNGGPPPPSGRVRLANLLQGGPNVDLCSRSDAPGAQWEGQKITDNPNGANPAGLAYGEVSTHFFVPVPTDAGSKYQFRIIPVGGACEGDAGGPLVSIAAGSNTQLNQGGGLTVAGVGLTSETGTEASPKSVVVADVLAPPAAVAELRIVHGVSDLPALDVLVNSEIVLQGVRYASGLPYPYSGSNGFANLAGGIPDGATISLKAGTTVRTFKAGARVRRGVAMTLFASGRAFASPGLSLELCADRSPPDGEVLATCTKLQEVK